MVLPAECNNKTDMFPPELYDPSSYCMGKYGVEVRDGWMDTQYWGKGESVAFLHTYQHTHTYICTSEPYVSD